MKEKTHLAKFIKEKRKIAKITQIELSDKADLGLKTVRDIEQGKKSIRMDSVNKILALFGAELGPVAINRE